MISILSFCDGHRSDGRYTILQWDKNSIGPAPPHPSSAVLITGFPGSTTADQLHRHFATYGRIESQDVKTDKATGGSLGICWIKFADDLPRNEAVSTAAMQKYERDRRKGLAQDGNAVALEAISKGSGQKIGPRMMMSSDGIVVVMDGDGKRCSLATKEEIARRNPVAQRTSISSATSSATPMSAPISSVSSMSDSHPLLRRPSDVSSARSSIASHHPSHPPSSAPHLVAPILPNVSVPLGPRNMRLNAPPTLPTRPIIPIPPNARPSESSSFNQRYSSVTAGREAMKLAVAGAVSQAKKRLELMGRKGRDESVDMDLDSSSESEAEDKVFFPRDRPVGNSPNKFEHREYGRRSTLGVTPAILWQASLFVLKEKLVENGNAYLTIAKPSFYSARTNGHSKFNPPTLTAAELARFFSGYELSKVSHDYPSSWCSY